MSEIYTKTFKKESVKCIEDLDNGVGMVEEQLLQLRLLMKKLTSTNQEETVKKNTDILDEMDICVSNLYSCKNALIENIGISDDEIFQ